MKRKRGVDDEDDDEPEENEKQVDLDQPTLKKRRLINVQPHDIMFHDVCVCLEAIEKSKKHKKDILRDFLKRNRSREFYPFMRLMLPDLDTDRGKFGLKERKLAEIYADTAEMSSRIKQKLKEWKASGDRISPTKFSLHVYEGLVEVGFPENQKDRRLPNAQTVTQMNTWLDEFQQLPKRNVPSYRNKIGQIINKLSALEHQYLIRIILKSMKIRMQGKSMLKLLHPHAHALYQREPNLKSLCVKVKDGTNLSLLDDHVIIPFTALKPMLAKPGHPNFLEKLLRQSNDDIFYEPKFDGERVLIHFSNTPAAGGEGNSRIDYYTRNGNNYNKTYGSFNPVVESTLKRRVQNCILDGEMLVYDERLDTLKEFGCNRQHAIEQPDGEHFCYQCFDILYLDGREITSEKYTMRKKILRNKIQPKKTVFEVVQEERITGGAEEINQRLEEAVADGNEGIMLKNGDSKYEFDQRKSWMKYKPYYLVSIEVLIIGCFYGTKFNRLSPSDFLCGIRRSSTKKRMINVDDDDDEKQQEEEEEKIREFCTFTKVGTGFNKSELTSLQSHMQEHWVTYDPARPPRWLAGRPPPANSEKYTPHCVIDDPENGMVLEVKCDAVVETDKYGMKYTLRHGRAKKVRYDKNWDECCDENGFEKFRYQIQNKKKVGDDMLLFGDDDDFEDEFYVDEDGNRKKRRKRRKRRNNNMGRRTMEPTVPRSFQRAVDPRDVEVEGNVFSGQEFVILNWEDYSPAYRGRPALEKIIVSLGGTVALNMREGRTTAAIAARESTKVKIIRESTRCVDVIKPCWLLEVAEKKRYVPLRYHHLIFATDQTKEDISKRVDKFGDVYTSHISPDEFLQFRDKIIDKSDDSDNEERMRDEDEENTTTTTQPNIKVEGEKKMFIKKKPKPGIVEHVRKRLKNSSRKTPYNNPVSFFLNDRFYLDQYATLGDPFSKMKYSKFGVAEQTILLHSGKVLKHPWNKLMDYIVVDLKGNSKEKVEENLKEIEKMMLPVEERTNCAVVDIGWVEQCSKLMRKAEFGPFFEKYL